MAFKTLEVAFYTFSSVKLLTLIKVV